MRRELRFAVLSLTGLQTGERNEKKSCEVHTRLQLSGEGSHFHIPTRLPVEALLWDGCRKMQANDNSAAFWASCPDALRSFLWHLGSAGSRVASWVPSASSLGCLAAQQGWAHRGVKMERGATKHGAQHKRQVGQSLL